MPLSGAGHEATSEGGMSWLNVCWSSALSVERGLFRQSSWKLSAGSNGLGTARAAEAGNCLHSHISLKHSCPQKAGPQLSLTGMPYAPGTQSGRSMLKVVHATVARAKSSGPQSFSPAVAHVAANPIAVPERGQSWSSYATWMPSNPSQLSRPMETGAQAGAA